MEKTGRAIVKLRIPILILAAILAVPSFLGFINTRVNYDILSYLPGDIDTMKGQDIMLEEFGKGGFAFVVLEGMNDNDVTELKSEFEQLDAVDKVIWYNSVADISVPKEVLPESIFDKFNKDNSTMMAVFFNTTSSDDSALDAVVKMREIAGKQCFVSGMTAVVEDIKELTMSEMAMYVVIAALLNLIVLSVTMDSFLIPVFFMTSVGMAILYNLGSNYFLGEISYITKALSAVLQLAVTMDYSIFLWHSSRAGSSCAGATMKRTRPSSALAARTGMPLRSSSSLSLSSRARSAARPTTVTLLSASSRVTPARSGRRSSGSGRTRVPSPARKEERSQRGTDFSMARRTEPGWST